MGLRDIMRKKDQLAQGGGSDEVVAEQTVRRLQGPEFGFLRTDSLAPDPPSVSPSPRHLSATVRHAGHSPARRSLDVLRRASRSRSTSASSQGSQRDGEQADAEGEPATAGHAGGGRSRNRLSQRLHHLRRRTGEPRRSDSVPEDLPEIVVGATGDADEAPQQHHQEEEAQWEWRATLLAERNEEVRPGSPSPAGGGLRMGSSRAIDGDIQVAIRLHEQGHLAESTALFGALADPAGANNPLSQVLYGLALRHGWGCAPDPAQAVQYLSTAASNAASVEALALSAGSSKGGAAKGELVLAIFELANCFRHGWGTPKDPVAAKQYYETAAHLGDTDAMNEVAWCYLEGYGCHKDKCAAARYYRQAENAGNKTLGNSWIWKPKYDPPGEAARSAR